MKLQLPDTWQWFERICHKLWQEIWNDANAQMNGRRGQPQHGVDVFGQPIYHTDYAGVQCKDKDGRIGSYLSTAEIDSECQNATKFSPRLFEYTIATTAPRDESAQCHARKLTIEKEYPFSVNVWSWDDIEQEILSRPTILNQFFMGIEYEQQYPATLVLSPYSPRNQFYAFFSRPVINHALSSRLREFLIPMLYELSDNSFSHGMSTRYSIECGTHAIILRDDGAEFNPLLQLDASNVSVSGNVGSFVVATFLDEFKDECTARYSRIASNNILENCLELIFQSPLNSFGDKKVMNLSVDMERAFGRLSASRLAASIEIPIGTSEIVLSVGRICNLSAFVRFISVLLNRLPQGVTLTVSVPREGLLTRFLTIYSEFWKDNRVTIRVR